MVSDHYLKKYSRNPIQTWYVHLLGECSEFIRFWATFAKFWASSGHKITENGGFQPLSEKVSSWGIMIARSISNMVFTLVRGVFTNRLYGPNLALLVTIFLFPFHLNRFQAGTCILWCLVIPWKTVDLSKGLHCPRQIILIDDIADLVFIWKWDMCPWPYSDSFTPPPPPPSLSDCSLKYEHVLQFNKNALMVWCNVF